MGTSRWSDDHYKERVNLRAATAEPTFKYSEDIGSGKTEAKAHKSLNPKDVGLRESCDSDAHPNSRAISIFLDVTGSMRQVPKIIQGKLPQLMGLLTRKGYLEQPHIMIGAIGDAPNPDKAPLQVGQFESGIEIENDLTNLYLEGGGGGGMTESYELAMYFLARHTKMDCLDKRDEKGYCFFIGDEMPYKNVKAKEVENVIGDKLQGDIALEEIIEELQKKFEVYFILPKMTSNFDHSSVRSRWKELLGQNFITMDDPEGVSELIATIIGVNEGKVESDAIAMDLADMGVDKGVAKAITRAVVPVAESRLARRPKGGELAVAGSGAGSGVAAL